MLRNLQAVELLKYNLIHWQVRSDTYWKPKMILCVINNFCELESWRLIFYITIIVYNGTRHQPIMLLIQQVNALQYNTLNSTLMYYFEMCQVINQYTGKSKWQYTVTRVAYCQYSTTQADQWYEISHLRACITVVISPIDGTWTDLICISVFS